MCLLFAVQSLAGRCFTSEIRRSHFAFWRAVTSSSRGPILFAILMYSTSQAPVLRWVLRRWTPCDRHRQVLDLWHNHLGEPAPSDDIWSALFWQDAFQKLPGRILVLCTRRRNVFYVSQNVLTGQKRVKGKGAERLLTTVQEARWRKQPSKTSTLTQRHRRPVNS